MYSIAPIVDESIVSQHASSDEPWQWDSSSVHDDNERL